MKYNDSIWITWEKHRRSIELAKELGSKLFILLESSSDIPFRPLRYIYLSAKTVYMIQREKPRIVFAQNPSILLAFILCVLKGTYNYKLIIDRHSNFKLETLSDRNIKWKIFHFISKYSIKKADITIVTNKNLCNLVNSWGGERVYFTG